MADPPKVPLAEAINEFAPVALKKVFIDARDAWSELLSALKATDDRWKNWNWIERSMRGDGNEPPGIDRARRAYAAVRSARDNLIADLVAQLRRGDLTSYMRADPITGDPFTPPASAWQGTVHVRGSHPGERPNAQFNFDDGSVFFWRPEARTFYDVQIARRAVEEDARERENADFKEASPAMIDASLQDCRVATADEVRDAVRYVFEAAPSGTYNVNSICKPVKSRLKGRGRIATNKMIMPISREPEFEPFKNERGRPPNRSY